MVYRLTRAVERTVIAVGGAGLVALMLLFCADVVARYALHRPIDGVMEMTTTLFLPLVVFMGMALSVRVDGQVRLGVIADRLPAIPQRALRGLALLVGAALWAAIAAVVGSRALASFQAGEVSTVSFGLPVFTGYAIVAAGSALMAIVSLLNIGQPPADTDPALDGV